MSFVRAESAARMPWSNLRTEWFGNVRNDLLAGMVVAFALIPEVIAFCAIAGVDPAVGLYASFCICVVIAIAGGRPAMISAAAGSVALVVVSLVRDHGVQYLFVATVLAGLIQIAFGLLRLGSLMRFVSRSVITGFENALAILIFGAQLPELTHVAWQAYAMVVGGLAIIYLFPRVTKAVPSALVSVVVLTAIAIGLHLPLHTIGGLGRLPTQLPAFALPHVPLNLETLAIVLPYSVSMALVGLLETLLTARIVDDFTETSSDKNRECMGLGAANMISSLFGGMAGCAMIGQSVINVRSGGRGRLSTLFAGCFLLFLIVALSNWVRQIPMPALVAVMIVVSFATFKWSSLRNLRKHPMTSNIVMVGTVAVTVATHDLSKGVLAGVLLSALFFVLKVSRLVRVRVETDGRELVYHVSGQLFFASAHTFVGAFDLKQTRERVRIDLSQAHFWDLTAVGALEGVVLRLRREGIGVEVTGLNEASATLVDRLGTQAPWSQVPASVASEEA
jgi:SulP family sulfate permease